VEIGTRRRGIEKIGERLFVKLAILSATQAVSTVDYCRQINTVYMPPAFFKILPGRKLQPSSKRVRMRAPSVSAR
jgi:hypothetical protein